MTPKIRQSIYQLGTIIPALLGLAMIWHGIDASTAVNISQVVTGIVAMFGAVPPAVAAVHVAKQTKDGTFDVISPADQVANGVKAVIDAQQAAAADLDKVKQAVTSAVGIIPGIGPLAQQVINSVIPSFQGGLPTAYSQFTDISQYQRPYDR